MNYQEIQEEMIYRPNDFKAKHGLLSHSPIKTVNDTAFKQMTAY